MNLENVKIAVIGQGYVGLPLAIEFGKKYETIGFGLFTVSSDSLVPNPPARITAFIFIDNYIN